jgi:eukaryotic-like serine/threonine-protein kinase
VIIPAAVSARPAPVRPGASPDSFSGQSATPDVPYAPSGSAPVRRDTTKKMGLTGRIAVGLVAAAVAVGVVFAFVAGGAAEEDPAEGPIRGEAPADPVEPFDIPPAPKVSAKGSGTRWTFTWKVPEPKPDDEFKLVLSGNGADQDAPEYTPATRKAVDVAVGKTICLTVSLSREGSPPSAPSDQVCVVGQG